MTNKEKHIPVGYKPSPLGPIPEDWEVKRLGEICKKIGSGVTPRGGQNVYLSQGHPFMRSQNVANGYLLLDDIVFIDEITHLKQKSTEVELDDVLLNITGASIGRCAVATQEIVGGNVNQHVCIIRLKDKTLAYYICTFLLSYFGQKQIDSYQAGGNREGLNYDQIASFKICIPTQSEILQIKYLLSLWDTAIAKQTALIEQLTLRKRGLMQQLLTGKKRLKGFGEAWKRYKLKELCSLIKGEQLNSDTLSERGLYPVINGGINPSGYYDKYNSMENTITISEGGNSCGYVNFIKTKFWSGGHCYMVKDLQNVDLYYLYYALKHIEPHIMNLRVGSGLPNVQLGPLQKLILIAPPIEEQTAIASVLVNADKEIEIQKQKLAAMQEQKKGLMQVLLTGKKRIKQHHYDNKNRIARIAAKH